MPNQDTKAGSLPHTDKILVQWAYEDRSGQVEAYEPPFQDILEREYRYQLSLRAPEAVCLGSPVEARADAKIWFNNGTRDVTVLMLWAVGASMDCPKLTQIPYGSTGNHTEWKVVALNMTPASLGLALSVPM